MRYGKMHCERLYTLQCVTFDGGRTYTYTGASGYNNFVVSCYGGPLRPEPHAVPSLVNSAAAN